MRLEPDSLKAHFLCLIDIPLLFGFFCFTYWLRYETPWFNWGPGAPDIEIYLRAFIFCSAFLYIIFSYNGLYQKGFRFTVQSNWNLWQSLFVGFLCFASLAFFYRDTEFSRTYFVMSFFTLGFGMTAVQWFKDKLIRRFAPKTFQVSRILVVGTSLRAVQAYQAFRQSRPELELSMIGPSTIHLPASVNYLGNLEIFSKLIKENEIDEVIIALTGNLDKQCLAIIGECENKKIRFSVLPELFDTLSQQLNIGDIYGVPVVPIGKHPRSYRLQLYLKRMFDIAASAGSILVLSPLLLLIYILIKLEDRGPIFYSQERVGMNGVVFPIYKFRSMRQDAETVTGPMWAIQGDPRWTKVGTILRKTSIDELPQLWNVLKGQMSLVGPRPERPVFVNEFKKHIPGYMMRHRVPGGLTGWAQVHGLRGQTSIEDRTTYDLYYVENWSFFLDIKIIYMTVFKAVFIQSGY